MSDACLQHSSWVKGYKPDGESPAAEELCPAHARSSARQTDLQGCSMVSVNPSCFAAVSERRKEDTLPLALYLSA